MWPPDSVGDWVAATAIAIGLLVNAGFIAVFLVGFVNGSIKTYRTTPAAMKEDAGCLLMLLVGIGLLLWAASC